MVNAVREGQALTPREEQYLYNLCKGMKPGEIAQEFGVTKKTIESMMKNIKVKMGAKTTWQVMYIYGTRRGLVGGKYVFF